MHSFAHFGLFVSSVYHAEAAPVVHYCDDVRSSERFTAPLSGKQLEIISKCPAPSGREEERPSILIGEGRDLSTVGLLCTSTSSNKECNMTVVNGVMLMLGGQSAPWLYPFGHTFTVVAEGQCDGSITPKVYDIRKSNLGSYSHYRSTSAVVPNLRDNLELGPLVDATELRRRGISVAMRPATNGGCLVEITRDNFDTQGIEGQVTDMFFAGTSFTPGGKGTYLQGQLWNHWDHIPDSLLKIHDGSVSGGGSSVAKKIAIGFAVGASLAAVGAGIYFLVLKFRASGKTSERKQQRTKSQPDAPRTTAKPKKVVEEVVKKQEKLTTLHFVRVHSEDFTEPIFFLCFTFLETMILGAILLAAVLSVSVRLLCFRKKAASTE